MERWIKGWRNRWMERERRDRDKMDVWKTKCKGGWTDGIKNGQMGGLVE